MALAGCPDYFLHHSNYQESMDRTSSHRPEELIVPGFQRSANENLPHHHDDDVDLEQLVNDMNSSMESVYSTQADTALLLNNGHVPPPHNHHMHPAYPAHGQAHRRHTPPLPLSSPSREKLRHSQPMHIQAVRCLQEEHLLRPASLPAIPNPFPELCSPAGSPVLSPILTADNHVSTPIPPFLYFLSTFLKLLLVTTVVVIYFGLLNVCDVLYLTTITREGVCVF
ncbi:growth factor receptor-bound protein 10-like isoform X2 [Anarrhichthys ocellatus]|uniref:growth factor receptor-bound protein 10-like isoform X2 n=1 Tax=Anarrhichthys ocellatus TaxID=433405 RepID=UPI0012EEA5D2|nr:growth factor receptor-bound protein 10-like isoform X2 [Anarrhichthys ocellatus]